jgi:hypothetical protein
MTYFGIMSPEAADLKGRNLLPAQIVRAGKEMGSRLNI